MKLTSDLRTTKESLSNQSIWTKQCKELGEVINEFDNLMEILSNKYNTSQERKPCEILIGEIPLRFDKVGKEDITTTSPRI